MSFAHIPDRWFSTGTHSMAQAVKFAEAELKRVKEGTVKSRSITLNEFARGFFTQADPHGYRHRLERRDTFYDDTYYLNHEARLNNHILPAHGSYLLTAIKDTMIEDFILDLPNLSNSTKNKILSCYRIVLREAVREGYIDSNPAERVTELPTRYKERDVFNEDEIRALFPEDDDELIALWNGRGGKDGLKYAVYFLIQKDTGWRPCEVSALFKINYFPEIRGVYTTSDVNWRTHKIQPRIKTTNKGQKFKSGFLTEQTDRLLRQLIAITPTDALFLLNKRYANGERYISCDIANKRFKAVSERAGVKLHGRTQYCFRHTFNTYALGNIPETARLLLMGHTSNRQEYNHLTPEQALVRVLRIEGVREALDIKKELPS